MIGVRQERISVNHLKYKKDWKFDCKSVETEFTMGFRKILGLMLHLNVDEVLYIVHKVIL